MNFKITLLFIALTITNIGVAQKLKYKRDVFSLIKDENFDQARTTLKLFLEENPNHINANFWGGVLFSSFGRENNNSKSLLFANKCFIRAFENALELDLSLATKSRYPQISGLETVVRLRNFRIYCKEEIELNNQNLERIREERRQKRIDEERLEKERKLKVAEDAKRKKVSGDPLDLKGIQTLMPPGIWGKLFPNDSLLTFLEISETFTGSYHYNIVNEQKALFGKLYAENSDNTAGIKGELIQGNGFITTYFVNPYESETIFMNAIISNNSIESIYIEKAGDYKGGIWYDSLVGNQVGSFNLDQTYSTSQEELERLLKFKKTALKEVRTTELLCDLVGVEEKYVSETEKVKVFELKPYYRYDKRFHDGMRPDNILLDETTLSIEQIVILQSQLKSHQKFRIETKEFQYEAQYLSIEKNEVKVVFLETEAVFEPLEYAKPYQEAPKVLVDELNKIAKKYVTAIISGDYSLYKSVVTDGPITIPARFDKLHSMGRGLEYRMSADVFPMSEKSKQNFSQRYKRNHKVQSVNLEGALVMTNYTNIDRSASEYWGTGFMVFVKRNGKWKILSNTFKAGLDIIEAKTLVLLEKERMDLCDLIKDALSGNLSYHNAKQHYYFSSTDFTEEQCSSIESCVSLACKGRGISVEDCLKKLESSISLVQSDKKSNDEYFNYDMYLSKNRRYH